jgi:hypothetical protein
MEFALVHKCLNLQFPMEIFLYKTCQLEIILYASFQKCGLHISSLVFQSMENLLPYPLCVATLDPQSSNVQIRNAIAKNYHVVQTEMYFCVNFSFLGTTCTIFFIGTALTFCCKCGV